METSNELKIALTFSGGGYRAAAFSLGVLTLLEKIPFKSKTLLDSIYVLSTVSGGTFAGASYLAGKQQQKSLAEIYKKLYAFMANQDLFSLAMERMPAKDSLIMAAADIYSELLFGGERFGLIANDNRPLHIRHFSFNATEFATGTQFRFQWSEKITGAPVAYQRGIIGNNFFNLPEIIAKQIRLGDIVAASSCFPGGFEPINFPVDFNLPENVGLVAPGGQPYPVALMDGGISDNQGIEPVRLAETRLKQDYQGITGQKPPANILDLIIVSDVTSPYMKPFTSAEKKGGIIGRLTPIATYIINSIVFVTAGTGLGFAISGHHIAWTIACTSILTISLVVYLATRLITSLPKRLGVPKAFLPTMGRLLRWPFSLYFGLLTNRLNSLIKMAMDVFLKGGRRAQYNNLYNDVSWKNRLIMNAIYELKPGEKELENKKASGKLRPELWPTAPMQEAALKASSMGTTLWFTQDELADGMLDAIIACGQFTMCWNLLEYFDKITADPANTNAQHQDLLSCRNLLTELWEKFKSDPYWQVKQLNTCTS